jgi:L-aminopeptidase/D-esterase-like protein
LVVAILAVNAFGDRLPPNGRAAIGDLSLAGPGPGPFDDETAANTTIGVVITNVALDKTGCLLVARAGHDGLARALWPVHTTVDGDALVAASVGGESAPVDVVAALANEAVALAVENALGEA